MRKDKRDDMRNEAGHRLLPKAAASAALLGALGLLQPAVAADEVKVGFVSTLSGPSASLGVDIRDAFMLAVKMNGVPFGRFRIL